MAGNSPITLNSVSCQAGDRLVIEIGYAKNCTSLGRFATFRYGDSSSTDLPEDFTTTTDLNPWISFSNAIKYLVSPVSVVIKNNPEANQSFFLLTDSSLNALNQRSSRLRVTKHNEQKITTLKGLK